MAASTSELQAQKHSGKGEGETVGIALLGFGTVGAEVFRLLGENADAFAPVSYTHLTLPTKRIV